MNIVGDYDDIDMTGIDSRFYESVPAEAQRRVISSEPMQRLIWNQRAMKFQIAYREPSVAQSFDDGSWLRGWQLIATFDPPLDVDQIISTMKKREEFVQFKLKQMGYESLEAYLDDADNMLAKESEKQVEEAVDDYWSLYTPGVIKVGGMGEIGNSDKLFEKRFKQKWDQTRRHSRTGKVLFVPPGIKR